MMPVEKSTNIHNVHTYMYKYIYVYYFTERIFQLKYLLNKSSEEKINSYRIKTNGGGLKMFTNP